MLLASHDLWVNFLALWAMKKKIKEWREKYQKRNIVFNNIFDFLIPLFTQISTFFYSNYHLQKHRVFFFLFLTGISRIFIYWLLVMFFFRCQIVNFFNIATFSPLFVCSPPSLVGFLFQKVPMLLLSFYWNFRASFNLHNRFTATSNRPLWHWPCSTQWDRMRHTVIRFFFIISISVAMDLDYISLWLICVSTAMGG